MKYNEFKEMSEAELVKKSKTLLKEIILSKMKNSMGQLANPLQIRLLRRDIAKVNTALTQKLSK